MSVPCFCHLALTIHTMFCSILVVDIVDILKGQDDIEDTELVMPIQLIGGSSDTDFITIHESVIKKLQSKYGAPDSNMSKYNSSCHLT